MWTMKYLYPVNTLDVDACDKSEHIILRGGKLYDKVTNSHTFEDSIDVDITWLLPFEDLPQAARNYIATRAARKFQTQMVGSQILYHYTTQEENLALADLKRIEVRNKDANMLTGSYSVGKIVRRRR